MGNAERNILSIYILPCAFYLNYRIDQRKVIYYLLTKMIQVMGRQHSRLCLTAIPREIGSRTLRDLFQGLVVRILVLPFPFLGLRAPILIPWAGFLWTLPLGVPLTRTCRRCRGRCFRLPRRIHECGQHGVPFRIWYFTALSHQVSHSGPTSAFSGSQKWDDKLSSNVPVNDENAPQGRNGKVFTAVVVLKNWLTLDTRYKKLKLERSWRKMTTQLEVWWRTDN